MQVELLMPAGGNDFAPTRAQHPWAAQGVQSQSLLAVGTPAAITRSLLPGTDHFQTMENAIPKTMH